MANVIAGLQVDIAINWSVPSSTIAWCFASVNSSDYRAVVQRFVNTGTGIDGVAVWVDEGQGTAALYQETGDWGDGVCHITLEPDGDDTLITFYYGGVERGSYTAANGDTTDWNNVVLQGYTNYYSAVALGPVANYETVVEFSNGASLTYQWNASSELDEWTIIQSYDDPVVSTGALLLDTTVVGNKQFAISQAWQDIPASPLLGGVSHCIASPNILRRLATTSAGIAREAYGTGVLANVSLPAVSGGGYDYPEICYTGAGGSGHLAAVFARTGDIGGGVTADTAYCTSNGVLLTGWSDVQQVRADRTCPCACAMPPTHDLYVIDILSAALGSASIAYGQRLAWNGSSFDIGTEQIVVSGGIAVERGSVVARPGGRLSYCYIDDAGAVQIIESANGGASWS